MEGFISRPRPNPNPNPNPNSNPNPNPNANPTPNPNPNQVEGFISRPREGSGRRTGDRQYVYVNRRPVDFPRLTRLMNEAFRSATAKSECFPVAFLNVSAPPWPQH